MEDRVKEIKGLAMQYCNQAISEQSEEAMKQAIHYFTLAGEADTTGYFFLGNLYTPKINAPFPDDQELAIAYFMKVSPKAEGLYAKAMDSIASYYYKEKKDYLYAAVYYHLAAKAAPDNKQYRNFYELSCSRIRDYKVWKACIESIQTIEEIEEKIEKTKKKLKLLCPKCKGTEVEKVSFLQNVNKLMKFRLGDKGLHVSYKCKKCGHTW